MWLHCLFPNPTCQDNQDMSVHVKRMFRLDTQMYVSNMIFEMYANCDPRSYNKLERDFQIMQ